MAHRTYCRGVSWEVEGDWYAELVLLGAASKGVKEAGLARGRRWAAVSSLQGVQELERPIELACPAAGGPGLCTPMSLGHWLQVSLGKGHGRG